MIDEALFERLAAQVPSSGPGRLAVLGIDGSWSSSGWSIATPEGPIAAGAWAPGTYRVRDLVRLLDRLADRVDTLPCAPGRRYLVVERAPQVYGGRGNQASTAYGLGSFVGSCEAWACMRPGWYYPWTPGSDDWRGWYWPPGGRRAGRAQLKQAAWQHVQAAWPAMIAGLSPHKPNEPWEGAGVDVAEAVMIAVGAARVARLGATAPKPSDRSLPPRLPRDWPVE